MLQYKVTLNGEIEKVNEFPFIVICVEDDSIICGNPDLAEEIARFIKKAKKIVV